MKRGPKHKQWRLNVGPKDSFDELFLAGGLIHLEMMTDTWLWMRVGKWTCSIDLKTGNQCPWEAY